MFRAMVIAVVLASFPLAACGDDDDGGGGGGDSVSAEDFAGDICTSTNDWVTSLQTRSTDLAESLGTNVSPQEGKDALAGYLDDVVGDTDVWIQAVEDAGVPDVEGGQAAADEIRTAAEDAKEVLEDTAASVDDLPTSDDQAFAREAGKVGEATQESLGNVGSAITEPESEELRTALTDAPACKELSGG